MTFVDSNILIDVLSADPTWLAWTLGQLEQCSAEGPLLINEIVYAEVSIHMAGQAAVDGAIESFGIELVHTPRAALYLAGQCFRRYREAGGTRTGVLPDFLVGAHAQVAGIPLLTRDMRRYRTYFPSLVLISPERSP